MGQAVAVPTHDVTTPLPAWPVWRRWFGWSTAGEVAGFLSPAVVGALTVSAPARVSVPALLVAGGVEGALLGWAQGHALRSVLPGLRLRRFATATAAGAVLAYLIGLAPSLLADQERAPSVLLLVLGAAIGGALLLGSIGTAQWWELRHVLRHSSSWVVTTGLSWAAALGVFMTVAMPLWHEGQQPWAVVLVAMAAGVCMAATVAALTGLALIRLLRREHVVR